MTDKNTLLEKIRALDFVLYETTLYLDGHPNCRRALNYYHKNRRLCDALKEEYTQKYGPLTANDVQDTDRWTWIDGPWPWEKEAN